MATALLSLILLAVYYFWAWAKVGRDPPAGPIVPQFAPPDGLSAAACRYIARMRGDDRGFTAAIVDLAVGGRVHIRQEEEGGWLRRGKTSLEWTGKEDPLPDPETAMARSLFASGDTVIVEQKNYKLLQNARAALDGELEKACAGSILIRHRSHAIWGLAGIPAAMLAVTWTALLVRAPAASLIELAGPPVALAALVAVVRLQALTESARGAARIRAWIGFIAAIAIGGVCGALSVSEVLFGGEWPIAVPLIALPFAIWAFLWIDAPTVEGRRVMDRIAGFRHYLGITEEKRLDALHPPEKTPALFERYLPYAIALDVETRWAKRFEGVLAAAAASGSTGHTASWYSGSGNFWSNPGRFASNVGSSLTGTVSSASSSPRSSSGGSSGGGGGGGGGSGW